MFSESFVRAFFGLRREPSETLPKFGPKVKDGDIVERLRAPESRARRLYVGEDGFVRDPEKLEAADTIDALRRRLLDRGNK